MKKEKQMSGIRSFAACCFLMLISFAGISQDVMLDRVEPPNWWTGFKDPTLQLMVHGKNIGLTTPRIGFTGVVIGKVHTVANPNYLFIDLVVTKTAFPCTFSIGFYMGDRRVADCNYSLHPRKPGSAERTSFTSADVIYLLVPDRFANGNPSNDNADGMLEQVNRSNPDGRHGGDIQGIADHAGFLKDLGVTALWSTPLLENNMAKYSYHGYSITDYYKVDPRFGTNDDYIALGEKLHANGIKLIMDMVFNHCGSGHWWIKDLPSPDWLNQHPEFTRTSYRAGTVSDPYLSDYDSAKFQSGWFDVTMPDLNQHNPFLAKYLIQNSIWWIETAALDGIRLDTYPYSFKDYMSAWDQAILKEYPDFNIVGECWSTVPDGIAYWQKDSPNKDGYNSHLPSVIDFAMYDAIRLGFMEQDGWNTGILRLYEILSQDFVYPDPQKIMVLADNHDVDRYLASQWQDIRKLKMAVAFILTSRGIPEIFYGTEVLLTTGEHKGDGAKRVDFPGGWPGDAVNAFAGTNLSAEQSDMFRFLTKILNWRKDQKVIHTGKLTHFVPVDGVYVYFRHDEEKTVMVAMNNSDYPKQIERMRYAEFLDRFRTAREVITGEIYEDLGQIEIPAKTAFILELGK